MIATVVGPVCWRAPFTNPFMFLPSGRRSAMRRSVANHTWRCTCAPTPASGRSSVTCAWNALVRSPRWTRTNASTQVSKLGDLFFVSIHLLIKHHIIHPFTQSEKNIWPKIRLHNYPNSWRYFSMIIIIIISLAIERKKKTETTLRRFATRARSRSTA